MLIKPGSACKFSLSHIQLELWGTLGGTLAGTLGTLVLSVHNYRGTLGTGNFGNFGDGELWGRWFLRCITTAAEEL